HTTVPTIASRTKPPASASKMKTRGVEPERRAETMVGAGDTAGCEGGTAIGIDEGGAYPCPDAGMGREAGGVAKLGSGEGGRGTSIAVGSTVRGPRTTCWTVRSSRDEGGASFAIGRVS